MYIVFHMIKGFSKSPIMPKLIIYYLGLLIYRLLTYKIYYVDGYF